MPTPVTHRPFRFGLQLRAGASGQDWSELAKRTEALGFDTLLVPDHIGYPLWAYGPALTAAATATTTLRVCPFVLDNDFRHPAFVAAEAATIDQISGGRFELGLGAGWDLADYQRTGIPFDPPGVRVGHLEESVQIIKGLFGEEPVTFNGRHYQIAELDGRRNRCSGRIRPCSIGAGGKRMLALAAREADIVSVIMRARREGGLDAADGSATASMASSPGCASRREQTLPSGSRCNTLVQRIVVTDHPADQLDGRARLRAARPGRDAPHRSPSIGSIEQIIETIQERRERWGISYLVVRPQYLDVDVLNDLDRIIARLAGT